MKYLYRIVLIMFAVTLSAAFIASLFVSIDDYNKGTPAAITWFVLAALAYVIFLLLKVIVLGDTLAHYVKNNPLRTRDLVLYIGITFILLYGGVYFWLRMNNYVS